MAEHGAAAGQSSLRLYGPGTTQIPAEPPLDRDGDLLDIIHHGGELAGNLNAMKTLCAQHQLAPEWEDFERFLADAFREKNIHNVGLNTREHLEPLMACIRLLKGDLTKCLYANDKARATDLLVRAHEAHFLQECRCMLRCSLRAED